MCSVRDRRTRERDHRGLERRREQRHVPVARLPDRSSGCDRRQNVGEHGQPRRDRPVRHTRDWSQSRRSRFRGVRRRLQPGENR